jgi:hypothetical protein
MGVTHDQAAATGISFGIHDLKHSDLKSDRWFDGLQDGVLKVSRGSAGNRQDLEQHFSIPRIIGQLLDYSDLANGGVPAGRTLAQSVLRRTESIIETIRQSLRKNIGSDVREITLKALHDRYHEHTKQTICEFLGNIHWRLLLSKAGCDADCLNVVEYSFRHNPLQFFSILHDDETDIPLIRNAPIHRFDQGTIANLKATALLKNVCGKKLGEEFDKSGHITVKQYGYKFVIKPGQFVDCTDPNGKSARLCIHTLGFAVNPIDEVIIAYLHLRHKFDEYMDMAIVHGREPGFRTDIRGKAAA